MAQLIFDEKSMIEGNLFSFEKRLQSAANRYVTESGAILTTYFNIRDNATTVDRGLRDIDKLFGHMSPLRFNKIRNFPLYGTSQANPNNTDESQVEDIVIDGEYIILPSTIVPNQNDFFIINHLKMKGIFQVTDVTYDSMKADGFYKIKYRLHSTSDEILQNLEQQTVEVYDCDLNAIGTNLNPIIREDTYILRRQVERMLNSMISAYRGLFYNERHNCFLFYNEENERLFDMCGNEFMAKYGLMNPANASQVIMLSDKLREPKFHLYYNNSIYKWIELDCPLHLLHKFHYILSDGDGYAVSSFARWCETDIRVMQPISLTQSKALYQEHSYFDENQLRCFMDPGAVPSNEYERLLHKFIHKRDRISIQDVSLNIHDALLNSINHIDVFVYTPIIIYIIRKILRMN